MDLVDEMVCLLGKAQFPIILAGGEILWSRAGKALIKLAETLEIPVTTGRDHPDVFPGDHPFGMGLIGEGKGGPGNKVTKRADKARLFNADGLQVERLDYVKKGINEGLRSDKPYLIDVRMDREELGNPGFM